jgi:hypothetical protein
MIVVDCRGLLWWVKDCATLKSSRGARRLFVYQGRFAVALQRPLAKAQT